MPELLQPKNHGLLCAEGDFSIDPMRPVPKAVITHAHADHARSGSDHYYAHEHSVPILRHRLGKDIQVTGLRYGEQLELGNTMVSLHSAGHILGSAQVRVESTDATWVVTGDFKRAPDPTAEPFEVVPCDTLITEATFGLPIYRWGPTQETAEQIVSWWRENRAAGRPSILCAYALGKAQRLMAEIARCDPQLIHLHGAMVKLTEIYREQGIALPATRAVTEVEDPSELREALVIAPPSALGTPWMKRFKKPATAFASGWMRIRGVRRRKGYHRGFVVSDHADWPALIQTIHDTGAQRILSTHGFAAELATYVTEELGLRGEELRGIAVRNEVSDGA